MSLHTFLHIFCVLAFQAQSNIRAILFTFSICGWVWQTVLSIGQLTDHHKGLHQSPLRDWDTKQRLTENENPPPPSPQPCQMMQTLFFANCTNCYSWLCKLNLHPITIEPISSIYVNKKVQKKSHQCKNLKYIGLGLSLKFIWHLLLLSVIDNFLLLW